MEKNILERMNLDIINIKYEFKELFDYDSFSNNHSSDELELLSDYISSSEFLFRKELDYLDWKEGDLKGEIDYSNIYNPRNESLILMEYIEDGEKYILGFLESYYDHFLDIIEYIKNGSIEEIEEEN